MNPERLVELEQVANAKNPVSWLSVLELIAEIRRLQHSIDEAIGCLHFHSTAGCKPCRETLEGWAPPFHPDHDLITYIEKKQ